MERFTGIKRRAKAGEKVNCTIEWNYKTYVEYKNTQFILTRDEEVLKSKDWSVIVEKLDHIIKYADNTKIEKLKNSKVREEAEKFIDHEGDVIYITGNERDGFWYVAKGSVNVNFTRKAEGDDINYWTDLDTFTWKEEINSLETFIEAVEK